VNCSNLSGPEFDQPSHLNDPGNRGFPSVFSVRAKFDFSLYSGEQIGNYNKFSISTLRRFRYP
jgi:hypothetical protein